MEFKFKENYDIEDLLRIMEMLRSENGCPWDREQDHKSIRKNFLEETYEVLEAIDTDDKELLKEELGDVLLQVVFHSRMEEEENCFSFSDVCDGVCKKLIYRHPHIFSDTKVSGAEEVLKNWEELKNKEKGRDKATETLMSVPKVFPALMRCQKVQQRASKAGMDIPSLKEAIRLLESEIDELKKDIEKGYKNGIEDELGDVIFSAVNVARLSGVDSEKAAGDSCEKFIKRFEAVEKELASKGSSIKETSEKELDEIWEKVKNM